MKISLTALICAFTLSGCFYGKAEEFQTSTGSTAPGSHIDWLGHDTRLLGDSKALALGEPLPASMLVNEKMRPEVLGGNGKVRLISVVPSLDTEVCDRQTHILSETKKLSPEVERITVSRDLPYAQGRFAEKSKLENLRYLSDYKGGEFGHKMGLEIERNGLLARALIVVDKAGIVRHLQVVPLIYALPDMEKAIGVANELSKPN
ncbi:MAG: redoxin family protein [Bdellovibrionota bacterium]